MNGRDRRVCRLSALGTEVLSCLPLGGCSALVAETDQSGGKPPLDEATDRRATAPAIGIASTVAVPRIVDPAESAAHHSSNVVAAAVRRGPAAASLRTTLDVLEVAASAILVRSSSTVGTGTMRPSGSR